MPLPYLCPVCLVLIILITASTAQECLNWEPGRLNSSLWAAVTGGHCEQGGRRCRGVTVALGLLLNHARYFGMITGQQKRTKKSCFCFCIVLVIFTASLPGVMPCLLMSLAFL